MTTTADIADKLASEHDLPRTKAKAIVDQVLAEISRSAAAGQEVSLAGFGKFKVKNTPERDGRNPSTGVTIKIAAGRKVTFVPAKAFKDAL